MINFSGGAGKEFELFFDIAIDMLCIMEPDGSFLKLNQGWAPVLGYDPQILKKYKVTDIVHPNDVGAIISAFKILQEGKSVPDFENRIRKNSGDYAWLEWRLHINNNLIYASARDITERKSNELLLKQSERRFRDLLNKAKLLSMIIDPNGTVTFINDFALEFTGYTSEEILHKNGIEIFISDLAERNKLKNLLRFGNIPDIIETPVKTKNGEEKKVKWTNAVLRDSLGNVTGIACIGEDITDFRIYEFILNFRYELMEKDDSNDINSLIQFTLDTAEYLTGSQYGIFRFYNEEDGTVKLQSASTNTLKDTMLVSYLGQSYNINKAGNWAESVIQRKPMIFNTVDSSGLMKNVPAGHPKISKQLICPIIKDDKIVAIINVGNKKNDYTQKDVEIISLLSDSLWNILFRKMTNNSLKASEEKLRELNSTKDRFFSIIAHDLKSPFQGLLGSLQILSSEFDYLSTDESKVLITSIDKLSQYTYKLLENLLHWSRIHTEHMEYSIQLFNLNNALNDTFELLSSNAQTKNITISRDIPAEYFVKADLNVTLTVFRNLLSNAIKFTNNNGLIKICAAQKNGYTEITVEDNGIGMTPEELNNLFLIQNQHKKLGTMGENGTGLGLILCKEMLERTGGSIEVMSDAGKGTTFSFRLPND